MAIGQKFNFPTAVNICPIIGTVIKVSVYRWEICRHFHSDCIKVRFDNVWVEASTVNSNSSRNIDVFYSDVNYSDLKAQCYSCGPQKYYPNFIDTLLNNTVQNLNLINNSYISCSKITSPCATLFSKNVQSITYCITTYIVWMPIGV